MRSAISNLTASLLISCAVGCVASAARAQDSITLDTVVVDGEGAGAGGDRTGTDPVEGYVTTVTTTGSKTSTPIIEIPQSISVVTTDQLEDRAVQTLNEALTYTAGVISAPFGNDPRFFSPIIRGFNANGNVFLNNFRFVRDFGALAFEPYGQERIEVVKGPASVLYGQAEPGGIVNLIQKRPTGTTFGEARGEIGSDNRYVAKFDVGGVVNDAMSYRFTGVGRVADGQQDFTEDNRLYLAPTITFEPDANTSLTILSSLQYDDITSPLGLPQSGTLDFNPNGRIPSSRYIGEPDFNDADGVLGTVGYEFRHRFNEQLEFRQNGQYLHFDSDFNNVYFFGLAADNRTVSRGPNVQSETIDSVSIDNQLEGRFTTGLAEHTTLLGLDYKQNSLFRSSNFTGPLTTIDVYDPIYGLAPIAFDPTGASFTDTRLQQTGVYAQDQIKIEKLNVSLGLRQDFSTTDDNITGLDQYDDALTGRAGALYLFDSGLAPFVGYSTSFIPTAGNNTDGSLFEPGEGEQIEGGVKFQPPGWNSFVTASVYDLTRTNVVVSQAVPTATGGLAQEISQTGEIQSRGFELEATASIVEGVDLLAAYTYTDAEITEGQDTVVNGLVTATTTGNQPANVPKHAASLWVNYTIQPGYRLEGLSLGLGTRYIGERFGQNANTIDLPSVVLFDAAVRYERGDFEAALNVNNLADNDYIATCSFGCFYGEGRQVLGSLTYKW